MRTGLSEMMTVDARSFNRCGYSLRRIHAKPEPNAPDNTGLPLCDTPLLPYRSKAGTVGKPWARASSDYKNFFIPKLVSSRLWTASLEYSSPVRHRGPDSPTHDSTRSKLWPHRWHPWTANRLFSKSHLSSLRWPPHIQLSLSLWEAKRPLSTLHSFHQAFTSLSGRAVAQQNPFSSHSSWIPQVQVGASQWSSALCQPSLTYVCSHSIASQFHFWQPGVILFARRIRIHASCMIAKRLAGTKENRSSDKWSDKMKVRSLLLIFCSVMLQKSASWSRMSVRCGRPGWAQRSDSSTGFRVRF